MMFYTYFNERAKEVSTEEIVEWLLNVEERTHKTPEMDFNFPDLGDLF